MGLGLAVSPHVSPPLRRWRHCMLYALSCIALLGAAATWWSLRTRLRVGPRYRIGPLASAVRQVEFAGGGERVTAALAHRGAGVVQLWRLSPPRRLAETAVADVADAVLVAPGGRVLVGHRRPWSGILGMPAPRDAPGRGRPGSASRTVPLVRVAGEPLAADAAGRWVLLGRRDGGTGLVTVAAGPPSARTLTAPASDTEHAAFSADGGTLVAADDGGHVGVWQTAPLRRLRVLDHGASAWCVAVSADGRLVGAASKWNGAHVWDAATGALLYRSGRGYLDTLLDDRILAMAIDARAGLVLIAHQRHGVEVGNLRTGARRWLDVGGWVQAIGLSADGRWAAFGSVLDTGGWISVYPLAALRR